MEHHTSRGALSLPQVTAAHSVWQVESEVIGSKQYFDACDKLSLIFDLSSKRIISSVDHASGKAPVSTELLLFYHATAGVEIESVPQKPFTTTEEAKVAQEFVNKVLTPRTNSVDSVASVRFDIHSACKDFESPWFRM